MAGVFPLSCRSKLPCFAHRLTILLLFFMTSALLDTAAEEQRVDPRVDSLTRLAKENNIGFWADEARCRRIVQFQDRAT
jgi:hypothetical protein